MFRQQSGEGNGLKAMVLAAGRGKRMAPLSDDLPKPLMDVGGETLIGMRLKALARAGIVDCVINVSYKKEAIMEAVGDGARYGVRARYSVEPEALETAGGVAQALPLLGDGAFVAVNADVFTDCPMSLLAQWARALDAAAASARLGGKRPKALAALVLAPNPDFKPQGDFALEGAGSEADPSPGDPNGLERWDATDPQSAPGGPSERSAGARDERDWDGLSGLARLIRKEDAAPGAMTYTFSGMGAYRPEFFASVKRGEPCPLLIPLLEALGRGQVWAAARCGLWMDVGTPGRLAQARAIRARPSDPPSDLGAR